MHMARGELAQAVQLCVLAVINHYMKRQALPQPRPLVPARNRPADTDMQARIFFEEGEALSRRLFAEAEEDLAAAAADRRRIARWVLGLLFTTVASGVAGFVVFMGG